MSNNIKIPIKNIYYMLSYAWNIWNIIDEDNNRKEIFGDEKFDNIYNVMAYILNMFLDKLIKRGFYKGYITLEEDLSVLKGKINFSKSIKRNTINYKKLVCSYNILSNDILFNQIIKSTLNKLINYKNIDNDILEKLIRLNHYFIKIKNINVNSRTFKSLKYNRNNMHYKIIINICKFIHKHLIVNKNSDEYSFIDFNEEKQQTEGNDQNKLDNDPNPTSIKIIDSTPINLDLIKHPWIETTMKVKGLKTHVVFDLTNRYPILFDITGARTNDINWAKTIKIEKGTTYVADRGYTDYNWWFDINLQGGFFVTRLKRDARIREIINKGGIYYEKVTGNITGFTSYI